MNTKPEIPDPVVTIARILAATNDLREKTDM